MSASTALQLYKLATSSPVNQRVGFEHYADDRLADATLRHKIYIAAADEKPLGAHQKQLSLFSSQISGEVEALDYAGLSVCGQIPNLE